MNIENLWKDREMLKSDIWFHFILAYVFSIESLIFAVETIDLKVVYFTLYIMMKSN